MNRKALLLIWLAALSGGGVTGAQAQDAPIAGASYVLETSAKPGCRPAVLHIVRNGFALSGVVFFKDGSGVSSVTGTTDGKAFQWTMARIRGAGPQGEVTGQVLPVGALQAKLTGSNCTLEATVPQYHDYGNG